MLPVTRARLVLIGVGLLVAAVVMGAIPRSEGYSDYGFGLMGRVDVECGLVFSRDQRVDFDDYYEEQEYYSDKASFGEPRIFEGQTETEVCDDLINTNRLWVIGLFIVGGAVLLFGLTRQRQDDTPAATTGGGQQSAESQPESTTSVDLDPPDIGTGESDPSGPPVESRPASAFPPPGTAGDDGAGNGSVGAADVNTGDEAPGDVVDKDASVAPLEVPPEPAPSAAATPEPSTAHLPPVSVVPVAHQTPSQDKADTMVLQRADGTEIEVETMVIIGRDPAPLADDGAHEIVPIADDLLLSKTHLAFGRDATGRLWMEDRHSTNGVWIHRDDDETRARPDRRIPLTPGDEIRYGGQVVRVLAASTSDIVPTTPPGGSGA